MELTWRTSASADEHNHDQETDLGPLGEPGGAVWATVSPDGRAGHRLWIWVIYNRWNDVDEGPDSVLASGEADEEGEAKEAVAAWVAKQRLEVLRAALRAGSISYGELAELQALAPYIEPGDTELLEAAGVPEHDDAEPGLTEYTFDRVAVITFTIGAPDYATARQAADGLLEFNIRDNTVEEAVGDPEGLTYEVTFAAPRGKASLVGSDPEDGDIPYPDVQTFTEPIVDVSLTDADIEAMHEALDTLDETAEGDSNDAEIEAGHDCADHLARLLELLGHPRPNHEED